MPGTDDETPVDASPPRAASGADLLGAVLPPDRYEAAVHLHNLAAVHQRRGELARAEALYRRALAIFEGVLGHHHPALATTLHNLGTIRMERGDYREARALFARTITTVEHLIRPDRRTLIIPGWAAQGKELKP
jgi:Tfp pilus assembly protein PilF